MRFSARTSWTGSTGLGWKNYDRTHTARVSEQTVTLTTAEKKGDPRLANPELLVLAAASSCQMLWFLHLAAKARIDVVSYEDELRGGDARRPVHARRPSAARSRSTATRARTAY